MSSTSVLPKVEVDVNTEQYGRYVIGPLEGGYGITLGNSLRRVLLSSLEGAAITAVRITDIAHEFTAVPGVREDVIQIILKLKQVRLSIVGEGPQYMTLRVDGAGEYTAGDIVAPPEIEILNPDLYLFTVLLRTVGACRSACCRWMRSSAQFGASTSGLTRLVLVS